MGFQCDTMIYKQKETVVTTVNLENISIYRLVIATRSYDAGMYINDYNNYIMKYLYALCTYCPSSYENVCIWNC
jgi:hypothetical protein